jgi:hypothetical protein
VLRSPYLLGVALFVVFVSAVNTILYFEQLRLVEERYADLADRTQIFARLDYVVQTLTIFSQVLVPVYRGADALVAQLRSALESAGLTAAGAAFMGAGVAALWAVNAWWLGRANKNA